VFRSKTKDDMIQTYVLYLTAVLTEDADETPSEKTFDVSTLQSGLNKLQRNRRILYAEHLHASCVDFDRIVQVNVTLGRKPTIYFVPLLSKVAALHRLVPSTVFEVPIRAFDNSYQSRCSV